MLGSVGLLALAMRTIPLSTAYPMWTGIGAVSAFRSALQSLNEQATDGGSHHGRDTHHYRAGDDEVDQCSLSNGHLEHFQVWRNRGIPFGLGS
jgi:hypothetical protein